MEKNLCSKYIIQKLCFVVGTYRIKGRELIRKCLDSALKNEYHSIGMV